MSIDARIERIIRRIDARFPLYSGEEEALWSALTRAAEKGASIPDAAEYWAYESLRSSAPNVCGADDAFMEANADYPRSVRRIAATTR